MKFKELKNKPVVAVAHADKIGYIGDILLDLKDQQVAGFKVDMRGFMKGHRDLPWRDIQSIGGDAVTVAAPDSVKDVDVVPDLESMTHGEKVLRSRVMSESGDQVGTVADVEFDEKTGAIGGIILSGGLVDRLERRVHMIPTSAVRSIGKDIVVIGDETAQQVS